jgi:predicted outer membrane repeat protein
MDIPHLPVYPPTIQTMLSLSCAIAGDAPMGDEPTAALCAVMRCPDAIVPRVAVRWWRLVALGGAVLLFLLVAWRHPLAASAAQLTVTTTNDTVANGDGLSLREAILCIDAGSNAPAADCPDPATTTYGSHDAILFVIPGSAPHTIALTAALPTVTKSVAIVAEPNTVTVDGGCMTDTNGNCTGGGVRPFAMNNPAADVTLSGLTIQHGNAVNGDGGAILNTGTVDIISCTLGRNISSGNANGGGALANEGGTATILSSTFILNTAGAGGTVSTQGGGAIYTGGGTLAIQSSTFRLNSTTGTNTGGGALLIHSGTVTITGTTIAFDTAAGSGGAIVDIGGTLTMVNSTLSGNTAVDGGGLDVNNSGSATLKNATIFQNQATAQTGTPQGGGVRVATGSTVNLVNTIIAGNTGPTSANGPDVFGAFTSGGHNLIGIVDGSTGFGATGDRTGTAAAPLAPVLGGLGAFGGSTDFVHGVLAGSPAIDGGDDAVCTAPGPGAVNNADERGVARTGFGAHCDIGAFEARGFTATITEGGNQAAAPGHAFGGPLTVRVTANGTGDPSGGVVTFTVNPVAGAGATLSAGTSGPGVVVSVTATANGTAGSYTVTASAAGMNSVAFTLTNGAVPCVVTSLQDPEEAGKRTLRDVMNTANGGGCAGSNIVAFDPGVFPAGTPMTITLNQISGMLRPTAETTIDGTGHAVIISGGGATSFFRVNAGIALSLTHLTLRDGGGGAISSIGTLSVTGCTFINNVAFGASSTDGGGVIFSNGTLTVLNSTFSGNSVRNNGSGGAILSLNTATITDSTFTGNTAPSGGAISTNSTLTVANSTFSGNSATSGGAIRLFTIGTATIKNSTIANNVTSGSGQGGGIATAGGTVNLANTIVAGNSGPVLANGPDVSGAFTSGGHNLIGIVDGSTGFTTGQDRTGTGTIPLNPLLGTPASNGGPTQTIAPFTGSPAIDAGDAGVCAAAPVNGKDQRGYLRQAARCTIGAFEADPAIPNALPGGKPPGGTGGAPGPLPAARPAGATQGNPAPDPLPAPRP